MASAWQRSWSKEFIWATPPFEWLLQVVQKFISNKANGILLLPDCSSTCPSKEAAYPGALDSITLADYTFPPQKKAFLEGKWHIIGFHALEGGYPGCLGRRIPRHPAI